MQGARVETEDADMAYQRTEENHRPTSLSDEPGAVHPEWGLFPNLSLAFMLLHPEAAYGNDQM